MLICWQITQSLISGEGEREKKGNYSMGFCNYVAANIFLKMSMSR
jgi:predicted membrane protein